jgi:DNA repair exonuclease SbcCD ATPase subunit
VSETEPVGSPGDGSEEQTPARVDAVDVERAPGFETGGVSIEDLSPKVNVVCGGNAAGKTTLSRAIRWSLWPEGSDVPSRARVQTRLTYDGEGRTVHLDSGVTNHLRDGTEAPPIPVPSLAGGERYTLSLEEMLQPSSDGGAFADAIQRESTGGFDVDAIREELGLEDGASRSTRNLGATQAAEEAVKEVERRRREEPDLSEERKELTEVERELDGAADARDRAELLQVAVEFAKASDEYSKADEAVDEFPDELAAFDGDELDKLERLRERVAHHGGAVWEAATTDRAAAAKIAETELDDCVPELELEVLRGHREKLAERESEHDRLERERDRAKREREKIREKLPLALNGDTLSEVETDELDDLRGFLTAVAVAERVDRARAAVDGAFEPAVEREPTADRETLVSGRDALVAWLTEPVLDEGEDRAESGDDTRLRPVAVGAGLLVAAVGVAVGLAGNPLGFLLALVGVAQAVYAWTADDSADDGRTTDPRETHRQQFIETGLEAPMEWSREAVGERLSELRSALADVETAETAAETRDRLRAEFDESGTRERVETARERLQASLGVDPDDGDELELGVAVERIERWQAADETVSAKQETLRAAREQIESRLSKVGELIDPYTTSSYDYTVETAPDVAGVIESLETRTERYEAARERRDEVASEVAAERERLREARDEYEALFTGRGLEVGSEERLRTLAEQYDDYDSAVSKRETANTRLEQRREDLQSHDDYDPEAGLEERDADDLESELDDVRERATDYNGLVERKNELETKIDSAKASTDVEAAVTERKEALTDLEVELEEDAGDAVADELLDAVADETAATSREPVFRRADELLREITNGAFELRLENGTFRAYDTREGRRVNLDDLSTGTRVQVLLSVRVAFVEHRETDTAPPLLLDDTLAVFDEIRAEEVIETVIGFARQGRQVFYFTARNDERERLRERLEDAGIDHEVHYLDGVYDDEPTNRAPRVDVDPSSVDVPEPDGDDHDAYGERLDVPTFDPRKGAETAHLWYVTEDPQVLYDFLSVRVDRWGQLNSLLETGSVDGLVSVDARDRLRRNGVALEAFTDAYTVGRGSPVDRDTLEDSGAVSEKFIDEASQLAERVDGDPGEVLQGLSEEVNYFRGEKVEELREFLREEGYIDLQETRTDEAVLMEVVNAYAGTGLSGDDADTLARRLLGRVSDGSDHVK